MRFGFASVVHALESVLGLGLFSPPLFLPCWLLPVAQCVVGTLQQRLSLPGSAPWMELVYQYVNHYLLCSFLAINNALNLKKELKLKLAFVLASAANGKQRSRIRTVNMDGKEVYELVTILCEESIYRYVAD